MKKKLLNLMMLLVALLMGGAAHGKVTTLPVTEDFEGDTHIFTGGQIQTNANTNLTNVLTAGSGNLAKLEFDVDESKEDNQPYTLKENEIVTFAYKAFNGWIGGVTTIGIKNSDGTVLVEYTYDCGKPCSITDVKIGGTTVSGFANIIAQSYNGGVGQKSANGYSDSNYNTSKKRDQRFVPDANKNLAVKIKISQSGYVEINFVLGYKNTDQTFYGNLPKGTKIDLASFEYISSTVTNSDRWCGIDDFSITTETKEVEMVNYTIKRVCGEEELSSEDFMAEENTELTVGKDVYWKDGKKYYYESDDYATQGNVSANKVYTIKYRKANEYTYTVTNSLGEQLISGTGIEGEAVTGNYVQYINKNGTLYEAQRLSTSVYYQYSFVPTKNDYNYNIEYKKSDKNNVVYLAEAEDIDGLTPVLNNNAPIRCSGGQGGYSSKAIKLTTLQPGKYTVTTVLWGGKQNDKSYHTIKAGDISVHTPATTGSIASSTSDVFEITVPTEITFEGGSSTRMLDYIYITKIAETVDLSADHIFSTFCSQSDLDFTDVEGVEAYAVTVDADANVNLTQVTKVPAGKGVLLKKTGEDTTVTVPVTTDATMTEENALVGVTEPVAAAELINKGNVYVLKNDKSFAKVVSGATGSIPAGKAYLVYNAASSQAKPSVLVFGDNNATAIDGVEEKAEAQSAAIYNVQGIKVEKAEKGGLYIVNGKKYIK